VSVTVNLPPVLRPVVGGARQLEAEGDSIAAAIEYLAARHPALALHFYDERGAIRRNIMFIHGDVAIRPPEAQTTMLRPGDEVTVTNALAGG
jgi:molybdopterin synthase sulfur carrier subunit